MAIKRISLSSQVLESIIKYVHEHEMRVGDKLPTEGELSEIFQVSRTSVREAMKALGFSGAVKSIPGKGTFIQSPMMDSILSDSTMLVFQANVSISQLMEVRTAMEILAAELAIERASDCDIEHIAEAMGEWQDAVYSHRPWAEQGTLFHVKIAEAAKNPLLVRFITSYSDTISKYKETMVLSNTDVDNARHIKEHVAIMEAIRARDKKAVRAAIRVHMKNSELNLKHLVNEKNALLFINK